jgi:hypothetical protein
LSEKYAVGLPSRNQERQAVARQLNDILAHQKQYLGYA